MQDQELVDLCKAIYRKHRQAIDLIVEYGTAASVVDAIKAAIESQVECPYLVQYPTTVWFVPKALADVLPWQDAATSPMKCWCYHARKENQLHMAFDLYQLPDPEKRVQFVQALQAAGLKLTAKALQPTTQSTTLGSAHQRLKLDEDGFADFSEDGVRPIVAALWKKVWKDGERIIEVVKNFHWG